MQSSSPPATDTKQFINLGDPGINLCIMSGKSWITTQVNDEYTSKPSFS